MVPPLRRTVLQPIAPGRAGEPTLAGNPLPRRRSRRREPTVIAKRPTRPLSDARERRAGNLLHFFLAFAEFSLTLNFTICLTSPTGIG